MKDLLWHTAALHKRVYPANSKMASFADSLLPSCGAVQPLQGAVMHGMACRHALCTARQDSSHQHATRPSLTPASAGSARRRTCTSAVPSRKPREQRLQECRVCARSITISRHRIVRTKYVPARSSHDGNKHCQAQASVASSAARRMVYSCKRWYYRCFLFGKKWKYKIQ